MPTIDLSTLPINAQQTLLDFYEFLQEKYGYTKLIRLPKHYLKSRTLWILRLLLLISLKWTAMCLSDNMIT